VRGEAADPGGDRGSETILLVEDEDMVRALAKDILKMNGYKVSRRLMATPPSI